MAERAGGNHARPGSPPGSLLDLADLPEDFSADIDRKACPYALRNLLRNAFKYAKERVAVRLERADSMLSIHVDDDGIGIPAEDREHVFSAFTRLDRSRDRSTGGYGLGLAIARRVMELHGGTARSDVSPWGSTAHPELATAATGLTVTVGHSASRPVTASPRNRHRPLARPSLECHPSQIAFPREKQHERPKPPGISRRRPALPV
ncbi:MAG: ATP-binding protein [Betaproteobacteria bacterium]|nr:ATP-binding protein [Betaproteobacteria bacterium]